MSTSTALAVLGAVLVVHTVVMLGLRRAALRPPVTPVGSEGDGGVAYLEVGAWSGLAYPPGAVVVGYNGRDHSRAAVVWAAHEAGRRGSPLVVLYAADYPGMTGEPGPGLHHREPGALEAAEEVTARGVAEAVATRPWIDVFGATEVTTAAEALAAASRDAALVVVGNRRLGRLYGALRGSVGSELAARAHSPVVVVGAGPRRTPGPRHPVVVGVDGSAAAEAAVLVAADRAAAASAPLQIVAATGRDDADGTDTWALRAAARRAVANAAKVAREMHPRLPVTTRIVDLPAEQALAGASVRAGLVVVGTRGRGPVTSALRGSTSRAVVQQAAAPVAVVGQGSEPDTRPDRSVVRAL